MLVERAPDVKPGRALLDEKHRQAAARTLAAGLCRDAVQIGVDAVGDEELGAVEDVAVRPASRRGADALHVGAGVGLRHRDGVMTSPAMMPGIQRARCSFRAAVEHVHRGHVGVDEHRIATPP